VRQAAAIVYNFIHAGLGRGRRAKPNAGTTPGCPFDYLRLERPLEGGEQGERNVLDITEVLRRVRREIVVPEGLDQPELNKDIDAAWQNYTGLEREPGKKTRTRGRKHARDIAVNA